MFNFFKRTLVFYHTIAIFGIAILGENEKTAVFDPQQPKMEKVRPLCFFQLLKLKETNWSYFSILGPLGPENGIF